GTGAIANAVGVSIRNGASGNSLGNNLISGNTLGVRIADAGTKSNVLRGNLIGLDASGKMEIGRNLNGIEISGGASGNTIGGIRTSDRNVISGSLIEGGFSPSYAAVS